MVPDETNSKFKIGSPVKGEEKVRSPLCLQCASDTVFDGSSVNKAHFVVVARSYFFD